MNAPVDRGFSGLRRRTRGTRNEDIDSDKFIACSNFPKCRYTEKIKKEKAGETVEGEEKEASSQEE